MKRITPLLLAALLLASCQNHRLPLEPGLAELDRTEVSAPLTVVPIPQQPDAETVPLFIGEPALANPIFAPPIPENRFLAPYAPTGVELHRDDFVRGRVDLAPPLIPQFAYLPPARLPNSLAL